MDRAASAEAAPVLPVISAPRMPSSPSRVAAPPSPDWGRSSGGESGPELSEEELGVSTGSFADVSSGHNLHPRSPSEEVDDERLRDVLTLG